jgi:probable F420-dependent oxidoreductase
MKVDAALRGDFSEAASEAAGHERRGRAGVWCPETKHDPFLTALRAIDATSTTTIGTAVVVALGRSPMTVASAAYDLAGASDGRFVLGLGTQVKPHIERRFSMPWSHPAARMREYVLALQAIWRTWQTGAPLEFEGEFYTHTLMTSFFSPPPHKAGPPPVMLAAVGELMTRVAGEVADGMLVHAFTTRRYVGDVTRPALEAAGAFERPSTRPFQLCGTPFVVVGRDEAEMAAALRAARERIAFYASTPAYRGVLAAHGLEDLQPELTSLSKQGRWEDMGAAVPDELLHEVAVVGEPVHAGRALRERWGAVLDRITPYSAVPLDLPVLDELSRAAAEQA